MRLFYSGADSVDYCMTHIFAHPSFVRGKAEIFFDRGERFMRFLERIWSRTKRNASGWPTYVASLNSVEMKEVMPVQMADLIAWSANRSHEGRPDDLWRTNQFRSVLGLHHHHELYGKKELLQHPGFFNWR
jgi:hypothetical protein